jgi:electron transfer flavoprotein alpha subunit
MTDILVVAELIGGELRKNTLSAVRFAHDVASATGGAYDILVIGEGADNAANEAAKYGARKVLKGEIPGGYVAEKHSPTVAEVAKSGGYGVVAATAGTTGKDLLPRVAGRLGAGVAQDIASVKVDGASLSPPDVRGQRPVTAR